MAEYELMRATGKTQESFSTTTHVAMPADPTAYGQQADPGSVYVEFDVAASSVRPTQQGWAKIVGPGSIEGRLAARRGQPIADMPDAFEIRLLWRKREDGVVVPVA